jgi:nucleoside-diphosphate-sugar epimerase
MSAKQHVIFGTGPMGTNIALELAARGKHEQIRMINRSGKAPVELPATIEVIAGNAYDPGFARAAAVGAEVVYQCAQPAYHEWEEKFPRLQAAIVEGAASNQAKLIVVENTYMYGRPSHGSLTEDLPYRPHTRKGKVRAAMSQSLLDAHRSGKVRVAMGRGSNFFGPYDPLYGDMIFKPALAGKGVSGFGSLDVPHTWTYVPDFARALVTLGEREDALGEAWHVPNSLAVTQRQLLTMVFEAAGQQPKIGLVNKLMMRLAGLFNKSAYEMVEMMYEFEEPFIVDSSKIERAFGLHATSLRDAVNETVAWFRRHPNFGH